MIKRGNKEGGADQPNCGRTFADIPQTEIQFVPRVNNLIFILLTKNKKTRPDGQALILGNLVFLDLH
jgi:hypothetical protein